jgi:hypothetical protein
MRAQTFDGSPLTPGVNLDHVDVKAGIRFAATLGYTSTMDMMVVNYALMRWARGEEDGAEQTWTSYFPHEFTQWRMILAHAIAEGQA